MEGIYYCKKGNSLSLLRFYSDNSVIGVSTNGDMENENSKKIYAWFDKIGKFIETGVYALGQYSLNENKIHFELSDASGKIAYSGEINNEGNIFLSIHSYINKYRGESIYTFFPNPLKNLSVQKAEENNNVQNPQIKKCPFCGEEILLEAIKCKHCSEWLEKRNPVSDFFNKTKNIIKDKLQPTDEKKLTHLFVPTFQKPLIIRNISIFPNRIEYQNKNIFFDRITHIYYAPSVQTINYVTTRIIPFIIYFSKENGTDNPINFNITKEIISEGGKLSKKEFDQIALSYQLVSTFTFEQRTLGYINQLKTKGYFIYDGFEFHANGDIIKESKILENLLSAYKQKQILFGSAWEGLQSSSSNPFELIFLSGGVRVKILGYQTGNKFKIQTAINHDVFKSLVLYFLKDGTYPF